MLTEQIKSLIENECALSPRLTGVFFRKHLNQSMYDDDGSPFNVITTLTNSNALLSKKPFMLVLNNVVFNTNNSKNQLNALISP
ncbi:TPA: hypothetical protein ACN35S_002789 [Vibrio parahaemolyticus]